PPEVVVNVLELADRVVVELEREVGVVDVPGSRLVAHREQPQAVTAGARAELAFRVLEVSLERAGVARDLDEDDTAGAEHSSAVGSPLEEKPRAEHEESADHGSDQGGPARGNRQRHETIFEPFFG